MAMHSTIYRLSGVAPFVYSARQGMLYKGFLVYRDTLRTHGREWRHARRRAEVDALHRLLFHLYADPMRDAESQRLMRMIERYETRHAVSLRIAPYAGM